MRDERTDAYVHYTVEARTEYAEWLRAERDAWRERAEAAERLRQRVTELADSLDRDAENLRSVAHADAAAQLREMLDEGGA